MLHGNGLTNIATPADAAISSLMPRLTCRSLLAKPRYI